MHRVPHSQTIVLCGAVSDGVAVSWGLDLARHLDCQYLFIFDLKDRA